MRLFLSYSRDDKAWVYELWRQLLSEGHFPWIDRDIPPTVDWWHEICRNIKSCECFVFIMTPKSVGSIYCMGELKYALALNKPILPLMLKPCEQPAALANGRVQYQDVGDLNMDRVLFKIERGLGQVALGLAAGIYAEKDLPYPDVPTPDKNPEHVFEAFALAEEAAAEGKDALAEQLFRHVMQADPHGLGVAANERLKEITHERDRTIAYGQVQRMTENPATRRGASALWRAFQQRYGDYDPHGIASALADAAPPAVKPPSPPAPKRPRPADLLPAPFAWVPIPAGRVTLETGGYVNDSNRIFDVPAFEIAKYPVTNAQFAKFIEADGYNQRKWWTEAGWEAKLKGWNWDGNKWVETGQAWAQPRYWTDAQWNGAMQPVVGVSWHESIAFCLWLREATGENISLPTEQQWQFAAQGTDGRAYPWGNNWDATRCNNHVESKGIGKTTPITAYEGKGDSPFGVVDMAGNVWEWCLTDYETGANDSHNSANRRVLRGGSWWNYNTDDFRCAFRGRNAPNVRDDLRGFRLARS